MIGFLEKLWLVWKVSLLQSHTSKRPFAGLSFDNLWPNSNRFFRLTQPVFSSNSIFFKLTHPQFSPNSKFRTIPCSDNFSTYYNFLTTLSFMFHIDPTCYNCLTKFSNSTKNCLTHSQKWSNSSWKWSNSKFRTSPCMNMPKNWSNDNPG